MDVSVNNGCVIRRSPFREIHRGGNKEVKKMEQEDLDGFSEEEIEGIETVSYTHLTLPTILLV